MKLPQAKSVSLYFWINETDNTTGGQQVLRRIT